MAVEDILTSSFTTNKLQSNLLLRLLRLPIDISPTSFASSTTTLLIQNGRLPSLRLQHAPSGPRLPEVRWILRPQAQERLSKGLFTPHGSIGL
jgi:hypothetical protein